MVDQVKIDELTTSLTGLVTRIISQAGLKADDVEALIVGMFSSDEEAVDVANNVKLITPYSANIAAQKAISDWVGATPGALDTLEELSAAFQNNPDVINEIMTELADRFTKAEATALISGTIASTIDPIIADLEERGIRGARNYGNPEYNNHVSSDPTTLGTIEFGVHYGVCTATRAGYGPGGAEVGVLKLIVGEHPTEPGEKIIDRSFTFGDTHIRSVTTTGSASNTTAWKRLLTETDLDDMNAEIIQIYDTLTAAFNDA